MGSVASSPLRWHTGLLVIACVIGGFLIVAPAAQDAGSRGAPQGAKGGGGRTGAGWPQNDDRYQDALIKVHDAALQAGKYFGNAGAQYLNGYKVSAATRFVQNGPARDGWTPAARGRGVRPLKRSRRLDSPAASRLRANLPPAADVAVERRS